VNVALERAREKAAAAGVSIRAFQADVTQVTASDVGIGFQLIVDNGLFHGLTDEGREAYAHLLSAVAVPHAILLLAGFAEKKRRGPRGFDRPEWNDVSAQTGTSSAMEWSLRCRGGPATRCSCTSCSADNPPDKKPSTCPPERVRHETGGLDRRELEPRCRVAAEP